MLEGHLVERHGKAQRGDAPQQGVEHDLKLGSCELLTDALMATVAEAQLLTGVTGPLLDTMFLRSPLERKEIIATKAACQVFGHGFKLFYFGALIQQAGTIEPWFLCLAVASSIVGSSLGRFVLIRAGWPR